MLAEAQSFARRPEPGLRTLNEAISVAQRTGEGSYEAELYRLKGEALLRQAHGRGFSRAATGGKAVVEAEPDAPAQAEACFNQSIKIAQRQNAKSLELRAAMSMSRLYRNQSRREEARTLLARIYSRFTEGFATTDLREAKRLLAELA